MICRLVILPEVKQQLQQTGSLFVINYEARFSTSKRNDENSGPSSK